MILNILIITFLVVLVIVIVAASSWYRIVSPSKAHLVVTPKEKFVVSSDDKVATNLKKTYFAIPSSIPFIGRSVRELDLTIRELVVTQETYEQNQARYKVRSSTKYRIVDVKTAAETFDNDKELEEQLHEVIKSSVRGVTVRHDVNDARAKKKEIEDAVRLEMSDDLEQWGLILVSFQLVDFQDTENSKIISNISKRREKEIESNTRQQNAEKEKIAVIKEAEAKEKSRTREIERDRVIGEQEQIKAQKIAEKQKEAKETEFQVIKIQTIRQAEIDKDKAIILANQQKEAEEINREKKRLEGEGDRKKAEELAKAEAAPIREKGIAEAEAKEKLQEALNKFGDAAIRALVAEKLVEKDKAVGIATAEALKEADMKIFSGNGSSQGFDLASLISSAKVADTETADALLNKLARPNDLGLSSLTKAKPTK